MFADIETPSVLIDLDIAERNIDHFQAHCDKHGLALRPHIKTHKLPRLAKYQLNAGAVGITCQKISEAEAMVAEGGIDDVLITYNILGEAKLNRLRTLARKIKVSVVADNRATIDGLSQAFAGENAPLDVLVECDTGGGRCGVQSPQKAADLAQYVSSKPGLSFRGLMTYPAADQAAAVQHWLSEAKELIEHAGLAVAVISNGGSPGMWQAQDTPIATEYRIGTYVYNDRSLQAHGTCTWDDCALTVLATVVSVPTKNRAVIDVGSKVLTSDLFGLEGFGHVVGRPDITVQGLSEEHGVLTADNIKLVVGDRVRIIPNHACVVSNMVDHVVLTRGSEIIGPERVAARGQVW